MSERDFEKEASADGWVPQDQWKGDPAKWIPAEDFVKRGETILPIVQAKFRKSLETIDQLKSTVGELQEGNKLFREFHEKTLTKAQKERDTLIAELEQTRAKAITDGDGQTFTQADKKIQELRAEQATKPQPQENPEVTAWKTENTWYTTDPALTAMADGLADTVKRENPTLKGKAFLDKLTERVKAEMPHKFENPRRSETITTGGGGKAKKGSRGYDDLPDDARRACDKFVKTIPGFTKEAYLSQYDWSEQS
jgi:hypothetical protein